MKYFCIMFISLLLVTGCSSSQWFSFPTKFTLCDVDVNYETASQEDYVIVVAAGWCHPAKFLRKEKIYND